MIQCIVCYIAFLLTYILSSVHREKMRTGSTNGVLRAECCRNVDFVLHLWPTVMLFLYVSLTLMHRVKTCM